MNPWIPIIIGGVLYKLTKADPEKSEQQLVEENQKLKKQLRANRKRLKKLQQECSVPTDSESNSEE